MTITNTSTLKLRQITYLHNGEESADAFNESLTILDTIYNYFVAGRYVNINEVDTSIYTTVGNLTSLDFINGDTSISVPIVSDRSTGKPIINRLALPY